MTQTWKIQRSTFILVRSTASDESEIVIPPQKTTNVTEARHLGLSTPLIEYGQIDKSKGKQ